MMGLDSDFGSLGGSPDASPTSGGSTLGLAGFGIAGMGLGMSTFGAYDYAKTQKATLNYEAGVAQNNATMADYQASVERDIGAQQEQAKRLQTAGLEGTQRATMAANGVDLGQGSAAEILTSTAMIGEHDALTIRDNAARKVWADQMMAQNFRSEANTDTAMANAVNPSKAALSTFLTGATGFASNWSKL